MTYDNLGQTLICTGVVVVNANPTIKIGVLMSPLDYPGELLSAMFVTNVNVLPTALTTAPTLLPFAHP
jgi:hypothetical protein